MQERKRAFTLIEVLVVIAVIGILAAIIFPVFSRARAEAFRAGDITSMNTLRNAVLLYREDQGAFPPQLLGYATLYSSGPNVGGVIPANRITSYLYPRRVSSLDTFRPSQNRVPNDQITGATWPNADPRDVGQGAQYDLNGDGQIDLTQDDPAGARQAFGPMAGCTNGLGVPDASCGTGTDLFYAISGYDVTRVPYIRATNPDPNNPSGSLLTPYELRYTLFWSFWALGIDPDTGSPSGSLGSGSDDPRQLGYNNPPDDTIITWNTWWRDYEQANVFSYTRVQPVVGRRDIVLTVGGSAKPADSRSLFARSWRYVP